MDDGQGGTAVRIDGSLTSDAFVVSAAVQQLLIRYRASDQSGIGDYAGLLRGPTFATVTAISPGPNDFEGDGDLIGIVDANGNAITLYRNPVTERVTSIEDPGGRSLDLA